MLTSWISGLAVVLVFACCCWAGDGKQRIVDEQLSYLGYLESAEAHLTAGDPAAALIELEQALSCQLRDSYVDYLGLETSGAAAHYLRGCCHALMDAPDQALVSLRAAADNGFRDTALVRTDPRLSALRKLDGFADVLAAFPNETPTDRFAGKMVVDRNFGVSMQKHRVGNFPKLGEQAPDFELDLLGGNEGGKLRLSKYRDKTPVVLVFGSFT